MADTLIVQNAVQTPLPHKDYTMGLLLRAAERGSIPQPRLEEIRTALHRAAAERAAAYTNGRSTTVTRAQAEAFYASVLCQLDTVLLMMHSDAQAEQALRTAPLQTLLEQGQLMTLHLYEEAKEHFRQGYKLTKPVMTSFFAALLKDFEKFCTQYDARFRAGDTKVTFSYPLLSEKAITEGGVFGVHRYYTALLREGELLRCFDAAEVRALMARYAESYLTAPDMIAENLAELVLRHWALRALCGDGACAVTVSKAVCEAFTARYANSAAERLCEDMRNAAANSVFAENPPMLAYIEDALPELAEALRARCAADRLSGWIAAEG